MRGNEKLELICIVIVHRLLRAVALDFVFVSFAADLCIVFVLGYIAGVFVLSLNWSCSRIHFC